MRIVCAPGCILSFIRDTASCLHYFRNFRVAATRIISSSYLWPRRFCVRWYRVEAREHCNANKFNNLWVSLVAREKPRRGSFGRPAGVLFARNATCRARKIRQHEQGFSAEPWVSISYFVPFLATVWYSALASLPYCVKRFLRVLHSCPAILLVYMDVRWRMHVYVFWRIPGKKQHSAGGYIL